VIEKCGRAPCDSRTGAIEKIEARAQLSMPPATTMLALRRARGSWGQHHGLHAGAAHFVHGGCASGKRQNCAEAACRAGACPLAGGEHAPEEDFVDFRCGVPARSTAARIRGGAEF